jgi:hypothetical protein
VAYLVATKRGKGRFVWVDRWTHWVAIQTGTIGRNAAPTLIELDDEDAADERVQREIARAKKAGFTVEKPPGKPKRAVDGDSLTFFGLGEVVPAQRGLVLPRAVSTALRAGSDDAAWSALAGTIREHAPALSPLLDRDNVDPTKLSPEQERLLFNDPKSLVPTVIASSTWRAAHIVECSLSYKRSLNVAGALTACGDAPAFAFVRSLDIAVLGAGILNNLNSLAPRLERLALQIDGKGTIPDRWFDRCKRLHTLELTAWPAEIWSCSFPTVTTLMVDVRHLGPNPDALAATLASIDAAAPKLTMLCPLVLAGWNRDGQCAVLLDVLAKSRLLPRLSRVIVESREELGSVDAERRRTWRGGAFAHLEQLELAAINLRLMR